jgi:hypothetical protein
VGFEVGALVHAEENPHYLDTERDIFRLAVHPVYSTLTLPWTLSDIVLGTMSQKEKEELQFRTAVWGGLSAAAYGSSWAAFGRPDTWPSFGRALGVVGSEIALSPWTKAATGVGAAFLAAFSVHRVFMDPNSTYYIAPDSPLLGMGPDSVMGSLAYAIAGDLVDLYESAF